MTDIDSIKRTLATLKGYITRSLKKFEDQLKFSDEELVKIEQKRVLERLHLDGGPSTENGIN